MRFAKEFPIFSDAARECCDACLGENYRGWREREEEEEGGFRRDGGMTDSNNSGTTIQPLVSGKQETGHGWDKSW